jgi:predicted ferric reductase
MSTQADAPWVWGRAILWLGVYLALVLAPLFVLIVESAPSGGGFWYDLSLALGFAGAAMMAVQFVLTARFKRMTAPYGIDIVYYFHRYLAVVGVLIVLAHPIILFVADPVYLTYLDPTEAPWHMTAGVISVVSLILLVALSLLRRRLRLHYDAWRATHAFLAIAAVGLAFAHIDGVAYYVSSGWKRALWMLIAASWIGLILYVRSVKPLFLLRHPYRVVRVAPEHGDAWTLVAEPEGHAGMQFVPGQFAWLVLRSSPFAMREHPFSISSAPRPSGGVEFTIKELGDFTRTIGTVQPGEICYLDGPYGSFGLAGSRAAELVFIAGGIGIAPMASMLRSLAEQGDRRPLTLIHACGSWPRVPLRDEMSRLAERLELKIVWVVEDPPPDWQGEVGRVDEALLGRHLPADRTTVEVLVCGPMAMIDSVERKLYRLGVPLGNSHSELFDLV